MAKLNQLILLENMMRTYDAMNIKDANLTHFQGVCIEKLVDEIIGRLKRLVVSKVRMSCRNVLLANYETMTKATYWLGCRLFSDLPRAESRVLREKVEQMVELLNELVLKIVNVDEEYAKSFFERIRQAYHKKRITKFELWKAQQSKITIEMLVTYQVDLTAEMLLCGILEYAGRPNGEDVQNVDKDKLALKLTDKSIINDDFIRECAKLRRYSHWEGDRFMIDYHLLRKYLFREFGKLTCEQHVKMYEYDIQMKQIHEEMVRMMPQKGREKEPQLLPIELTSRRARRILARAVEALLLTADYQRPADVEWWKIACMADVIGDELSLPNKWVVFCSLWGNSNLRKYNIDKQGMTDYNNFRKILRKQIL